MTKIKNKNLIFFLFFALSFFVILTVFSFFYTSKKEYKFAFAIEDQTIASEYLLGEEVNIPTEIEVEYKGENYTAKNGVVKFPDSSIVSCGNITLSQEGKYLVSYCAVIGGNTYSFAKEFVVSKNLCYIANENGSIVGVTKDEQTSLVYEKSTDNVTQAKEDALIVRLADKNTFSYTKSIDLTKTGEDGLCDIITLDYNLSNFALNEQYVEGTTPEKWKKYKQTSESATYCIVRLTDSYDETVYVELVCHFDGAVEGPSNKLDSSYDVNTATWPAYKGVFTARAVGQVRTGAIPWRSDLNEWGGFKKHTVNGNEYGFYIDNRLGLDSYVVLGQAFTMDHLPYTWKYDYNTNNVYLQVGNKVALVTSLSNNNLYPNNTFSGFDSGKVKLSVYMSEYITDKEGRVDIYSIADSTGADLLEGIIAKGYRDDVAKPQIKVNIEKTDYNGVYAPLNSSYTIPTATVIGGNGSNGYNVFAYINYDTDIQIDVPIVNGAINIDKNCQYTIVYKAENAIGVESEYVFNVNPVDATSPITVNADFSTFSNVSAGQELTLPSYTVTTLNKEDKLNVVIKAVQGDNVEIIDNSTLKFVPKYVGEYKIVFECTDNVYTVKKEYTFNCVASNNVGFLDKLVLPKYLIKDARYSLPDISGYEFSSNVPQKIDTKVYVKFDGGAYTLVSNILDVKITGSIVAQFKYEVSKNANTAVLESNEIKIVDVNYANKKDLYIKNYFKHDGFTVTPFDIETNPKTDVKYDINVKTGSYSLDFINAIDINKLDLKFKLLSGLSNYEKFNIKFTDYYDQNNTFTICLYKEGTSCMANLNNEREIKTSYFFEDDSVTKKISYNYILKRLSINGVEIDYDLNKIFKSNLCYFQYELIDIYGASSVIVDTVGNQSFRQKFSNNSDNILPMISYEDFSGQFHKGQTVAISVPCASDVLSPILFNNVTLTVTKDGIPMTSIDGVRLDGCNAYRGYSIKLNELGTYIVSYNIKDGFGNEQPQTVTLSVVDSVAPTIEFKKGYLNNQKLTCKVGTSIDFGTTVTDDICSAEEINISAFIKDCKAGAIYYFEKDVYKFDKKGTFDFYVLAQDKTGNLSYAKITIVVE